MADILIGNYSPEEVIVIFSVAGVTEQISGFADGTFITASRMIPASEPYIGSDLTGGRVKRRNRSMNITLSLHQYAASNTFLQEVQRADENDSGNSYVGSMTIKDNSGQTLFFSSQTIIASTPDVTLSSTTETRDWQFFMFNSDNYIGGNTQLSDSTVNAIESLGGSVDARWRLNA